MPKKPEKIISNLKKAHDRMPIIKHTPGRVDVYYSREVAERDMREEARNLGSHQAEQMWGDNASD